MQIAEHPNKRLLCTILSIFALTEHPQAKSEHLTLKSPHKIDLCGVLPGDTTLNEMSQFIRQNGTPGRYALEYSVFLHEFQKIVKCSS